MKNLFCNGVSARVEKQDIMQDHWNNYDNQNSMWDDVPAFSLVNPTSLGLVVTAISGESVQSFLGYYGDTSKLKPGVKFTITLVAYAGLYNINYPIYIRLYIRDSQSGLEFFSSDQLQIFVFNEEGSYQEYTMSGICPASMKDNPELRIVVPLQYENEEVYDEVTFAYINLVIEASQPTPLPILIEQTYNSKDVSLESPMNALVEPVSDPKISSGNTYPGAIFHRDIGLPPTDYPSPHNYNNINIDHITKILENCSRGKGLTGTFEMGDGYSITDPKNPATVYVPFESSFFTYIPIVKFRWVSPFASEDMTFHAKGANAYDTINVSAHSKGIASGLAGMQTGYRVRDVTTSGFYFIRDIQLAGIESTTGYKDLGADLFKDKKTVIVWSAIGI